MLIHDRLTIVGDAKMLHVGGSHRSRAPRVTAFDIAPYRMPYAIGQQRDEPVWRHGKSVSVVRQAALPLEIDTRRRLIGYAIMMQLLDIGHQKPRVIGEPIDRVKSPAIVLPINLGDVELVLEDLFVFLLFE